MALYVMPMEIAPRERGVLKMQVPVNSYPFLERSVPRNRLAWRGPSVLRESAQLLGRDRVRPARVALDLLFVTMALAFRRAVPVFSAAGVILVPPSWCA